MKWSTPTPAIQAAAGRGNSPTRVSSPEAMATTKKQITPTGFVSTIPCAGVPVTTPRLAVAFVAAKLAAEYGEKGAKHGFCHAPRWSLWPRARDFARACPGLGAFRWSGAIATSPAPAQPSPASEPPREALHSGRLALGSGSKFATPGAPISRILLNM